MLTKFYRYSSGYITLYVLVGLKNKNFFAFLEDIGAISLEDMAKHIQLDMASLVPVIKLLESLGFMSRSQQEEFSLTSSGVDMLHRLFDGLSLHEWSVPSLQAEQLIAAQPENTLMQTSHALVTYFELVKQLLQQDDMWADFCHGYLLFPLLNQLSALDVLNHPQRMNPSLSRLFVELGWIDDGHPQIWNKQGIESIEAYKSIGESDTFHELSQLAWSVNISQEPSQGTPSLDLWAPSVHSQGKGEIKRLDFIDKTCLDDFDEVLSTLFNQTALADQPKCILLVGDEQGQLSQHVADIIRHKTLRGQAIGEHPLRVYVLGGNQALEQHKSPPINDILPQSLLANLDSLKDLQALFTEHQIDLNHTLWVSLDSKPSTAMFFEWTDLVSRHGLLAIQSHGVSIPFFQTNFSPNSLWSILNPSAKAQDFIMQAASVKLFPSFDCAKRYPVDQTYSSWTLNHFQPREYLVRTATAEDIPALLKLEKECWPKPLRATTKQLQSRIDRHPSGQYVAVLAGNVVGVVYTQRLNDEKDIFAYNYRQIETRHDNQGPFLQLLAANVLPHTQGQGLGDQLIEFVLQRSALMADINSVVAVTRCRHFDAKEHTSMHDYIHRRNRDGIILDPVLYFHALHGAMIDSVVEGYRPNDTINQDAGVLIRYDNRARIRLDHQQAHAQTQSVAIPADEQLRIIEDAIENILKTKGDLALDLNVSLMQLGFESIDLLTLAGSLNQRLGLNLRADFFLEHGTTNAIIQAISKLSATNSHGPVRPGYPAPHANTKKTPSEKQLKLHKTNANNQEKIAIVGLSCRLPGGVSTPNEFWHLLEEGRDAISEVPSTRWDKAGKHQHAGFGGFLDQVAYFDAPFFNTTAGEAVALDPQQRIHLESVWHALEDAGINPQDLSEQAVGIYLGLFSEDYKQICLDAHQDNTVYFGTGTSAAAAAGRTAFFLGTQGPAMTINTACSSSLVALHHAKESLLRGETNLAIASGVNIMLSPQLSENFALAGMLSPDGRCKSFSGSANGYVRSEGCAVVVLKRLSDAIAEGDQIYAVIESSVVNQDGKSSVLTAPNPDAQRKLFESALSAANLQSHQVDFIEAHGTGTSLGDAMEANSILAVYGRDRQKPLTVGSVKANIGHTESTAGLAGLIKIILSLEHEQIPKQLHVETLNAQIDDQQKISIPKVSKPWNKKPNGDKRIAGISSFGFTGTNAHALVSEAPLLEIKTRIKSSRTHHLLTISARSAEALEALVRDYIQAAIANPSSRTEDWCYSSNVSRAHFEYRIALPLASNESLEASLNKRLQEAKFKRSTRTKLAFLFSGQGSQYVGMGLTLYETEPVYQHAFETCLQGFAGELHLNINELRDVIFSGPSDTLNQTLHTQIGLFALEYALSVWWQAMGIRPQVVMGHSIGECVAAVVACVMSLEDGIKLVAHRARLMQAIDENGGMLAVNMSFDALQPLLQDFNQNKDRANQLYTAADNAPKQIVIAGICTQLDAFALILAAQNIRCVRLPVSQAFHSPLLEPMLAEYRAIAESINYNPPVMGLISNVTGEKIAKIDAAYWVMQVSQAVRCRQGFQSLAALGVTHYLELGPKPLLSLIGPQNLDDPKFIWLSSIDPRNDKAATLTHRLAVLYEAGIHVDWRSYHADFMGCYNKIKLPYYHFIRQYYWPKITKTVTDSLEPNNPSLHPLLGARLPAIAPDDLNRVVFQSQWPAAHLDFLNDHQVIHTQVVPGAALIEMCLMAVQLGFATPIQSGHLADISIEAALSPSAARPRTIQTLIEKTSSGYAVRIFSRELHTSTWRLHASARWENQPLIDEKIDTKLDILALQALGKVQNIPDLYARFDRMGLNYGEAFRGIRACFLAETHILAEVVLEANQQEYTLPPSLLDGCFQALIAMQTEDDLYMPIGVRALSVKAPLPQRIFVLGEFLADSHHDMLKGRALITDEQGQVLAQAEGFTAKRTSAQALDNMLSEEQTSSIDTWFYTNPWLPKPAAVDFIPSGFSSENSGKIWLLLATDPLTLTDLKTALCAQGYTVCVAQLVEDEQNLEPLDASASWFKLSMANVQPLALWMQTNGPQLEGMIWADEPKNQPIDISEEGLLTRGQRHQYGFVLSLMKWIQQQPLTIRLVMVTQGAQAVNHDDCTNPLAASIWGLATTARQELSKLNPLVIDADPKQSLNTQAKKMAEVILTQSEHWVVLRSDELYVRRLKAQREFKPALILPKEKAFEVAKSSTGDLHALIYKPIQAKTLADDEISIRVFAVGLNFRDVLNAMNEYPGNPGPLGCDCAGEIIRVGSNVTHVKPGDRVMAMALGCLRTEVVVHADLVTPIPDSLSWNDAATIPTVFLTVYECLIEQAKLKRGDRVLIHTATGGVGLSAIQICQWIGAEIYATAGSEAKQAYLKSLGVKHISSSRDLNFKEDMRDQDGQPVIDVVLNTLTGEGFIEASLSVCRPDARFIEISKIKTWTPAKMAEVRPDIHYALVALDTIAQQTPQHVAKIWRDLLPLFTQGSLRALPQQTFALTQVRDAFTSMQKALHIGKIVVEIPTLAHIERLRQEPEIVTCDFSNGTHLVTGGLGGLGMATAGWLLAHQAKSIILVSRREPSEAIQKQLDQWSAQFTASIEVWSCDLGDKQAVLALVDRIHHQSLPRLQGVIHAAGVLDDGLLAKQNWASFEAVSRSKVLGAWYLHEALVNQPLAYFVMYSSMTAVLGNVGQINYGAANACLDSLVAYRRQQGLVAQSINWGPWAEVGMAAGLNDAFSANGLSSISVSQGLQALGRILMHPRMGQTMITPIHWPKYLKSILPDAFLDDFMGHKPNTNPSNKSHAWIDALAAVAHPERMRLMKLKLEEIISPMLKVTDGPVDLTHGFTDMGLDSLNLIDARNQINALFAPIHSFSSTLMFDYPSIKKISEYILNEVVFKEKNSAVTPQKVNSNQRPTQSKPQPSSQIQDAQAINLPHPMPQAHEPIALIGMSCRFPGGANNPQSYWDLLASGQDAISKIPADRWDVDSFYDGDAVNHDKMISRHGGFLTQSIREFDASFFQISPREAELLDPQQRLLLEIVWEALEHANIDPTSLAETLTGVYMGMCGHDYKDMLVRAESMTGQSFRNIYTETGNAFSTATGRISYAFGLQGPNLSIDTACSSSLVSVHEACLSLQSGESNLAIAGGVNLLLSPEVSVNFSQGKMLSPDGHCKTFDEKANGYVRSEGCGAVILKRLSDAKADGDCILAVIHGSAVNQDGASSGLTVPNGPAQERLIRTALSKANIAAQDVSYVEAHGTGTQLGDPIEMTAIGNVYGADRQADNRYVIGTAKVNIGHLEGAAGIAGLIKLVLSLQNATIPPHRNFTQVNPKIDLFRAKARITTQKETWQTRGSQGLVAGLSSFGFGGTNAHLIVGEAPLSKKIVAKPHHRQHHLLTISAKNPEALHGLIEDYVSYFSANPDLLAEEICYTSNVARTDFDVRVAVPVPSHASASDVSQILQKRWVTGIKDSVKTDKKLAFLFTGQGSQWIGMGAIWYAQEPLFHSVFEDCLGRFKNELDSLIDIDLLRELVISDQATSLLSGEEQVLQQTLYSQIAIFSLEYALAKTWQAFGVLPDAVMGHSIGECVAAVVAEILSLGDGIKLVACRARLMQSLDANGLMVAVQCGKAAIVQSLSTYHQQHPERILVIAADNAPNQVVLSGEAVAIHEFIDGFIKPQAWRFTLLEVSNAFHSPCMQPIVTEFLALAKTLSYHPPTLKVICNVTGSPASNQMQNAEYWVAQLLQTVRCHEGFQALNQLGITDYLEIGPKPILIQFGQQSLPDQACQWFASVNSKRGMQEQSAYVALAALYEAGYQINWQIFHQQTRALGYNPVSLPTYHFIRKRHWPAVLDELMLRPNTMQQVVPVSAADSIDYEVIIIGGGAAGLSALGRLKANQHDNVLLLEQEAHYGGIWYTTKYPNVGIQSKNFSYRFFDFDAPQSLGEHATAGEIVSYFSSYIEQKDLAKQIQVSQRVNKIVYFKDNLGAHRCSVHVENTLTGEVRILKSTHVVCALGFSSAGHINKPQFKGAESFNGKVLHSSEFDQAMLDDIASNQKKVCILGAGKSAYDLVLQTSRINPDQVTWIYDKFLWGLNYDFIYKANEAELRKVYAMYAEYEKHYKQNPHSQAAIAAAKQIIDTGYLINIEEQNVDIYQSRSAIYKPDELLWLKDKVQRIKAKIAHLNDQTLVLDNGATLQADYLICATGYQHASNLPQIVIDSAGVEEIYDMRSQAMLFRSLIDPNIPHIAMFTGQTLFPQQLLIYSIAAEWFCRFIQGGLERDYAPKDIEAEIHEDIRIHGSRYNWHPSRTSHLSQGSNYIIDSPFLYFKRMCEDLGLSRAFSSDLGVAIAHEETFERIRVEMLKTLQRVSSPKRSVKLPYLTIPLSSQLKSLKSSSSSLSLHHAMEQIAVEELLSMSKEQRMQVVQRIAMHTLRQVMSLKDEEVVTPRDTFTRLGLDSLAWGEFRGGLSKALQMQFGNRFLNCLDINGVVNYVEDELFSAELLDFDHQAERDFDRLDEQERDAYYQSVDEKHQFLIDAGFKRYQIAASTEVSTEVYCGGSGETIVLLPPLNCGINAWCEQLKVLSQQYRVISLHYPGYGRSGFDPKRVSIEAIADQVHDVLGIVSAGQPFHLVGWSYGGHVCLPYAKKYPHTLLSLTLVSTTACLESMYQSSNYETFDKIMKGLIKDFTESVACQPENSNKKQSRIDDLKGTYGIHTFTHFALDVTQFDYRDQVNDIHVPTLIIAGGRDALTTPAYMQTIAERIEGSTYHEHQNAGHYLPFFHAEYFNTLLLSFIKNNPLTAQQRQSIEAAPTSRYQTQQTATFFNQGSSQNQAHPNQQNAGCLPGGCVIS